MKLSSFKSDPLGTWLYLERYVNKGSPSGYTQVYHPPGIYAPHSETAEFNLPRFSIQSSELLTYGSVPSQFELSDEGGCFFMHPVAFGNKDFGVWTGLKVDRLRTDSFLRVSPTASGRTVWVHDSAPLSHLKLHYPGVLGRVNRELPFQKAVAGPELWYSLKPILDAGKAPSSLAFFPEVAARLWYPPAGNLDSIGLIFREARPYPFVPDGFVLPVFSLFSRDSNSPTDRLLIHQLIDDKAKPKEFLFEAILSPMIEIYVFLVFSLGLLPELNAQNILLETSTDFIPRKIIVRDLSRFEKNLDIRKKRGLKTNFISGKYKTIDSATDDVAKIRHSFSYDFKLGQYVMAELIDCCAAEYGFDAHEVDDNVSDLFGDLASKYLAEYFPPGNVWYSHDKIMLTVERPYTSNSNPRFRRCQ